MALLGSIAGESSLSSALGRWRQYVSEVLTTENGLASASGTLSRLRAASGEISFSSAYGRWATALSMAIDSQNTPAVLALLMNSTGERGNGATHQWDMILSNLDAPIMQG